ncbi:hypothetical protein BD413DRAFT_491998 [Trametes elegans]|nr:hypothetical protein BD413DRAFT_491998 [Trametes elegans]
MHTPSHVPDNDDGLNTLTSQPFTPKPGNIYRVLETPTAPISTALLVRGIPRPRGAQYLRTPEAKQLSFVAGAQDSRDYHAHLCVVMPGSDTGSAGTITICLIVAFERKETMDGLPTILRRFSVPVPLHILTRLAGEGGPHWSLPPRFSENAHYIAFPYPFKSHRRAATIENTGHILASAELADLIDSCQRKKEEWQALLSTNPEEFVRYRQEYEEFLRPLSPSPLPPRENVSSEPNLLTKAVPLATVEVVETEPMSDSPVDPALRQQALTPVVAESTY